MRVIKFRSWDNKNKQMDFPDNIANDIDIKKYDITQYAGLKDKHGKEIYEGDYVTIKTTKKLFEVKYPFKELFYYHDENIIGEIKGNIYENSELLED